MRPTLQLLRAPLMGAALVLFLPCVGILLTAAALGQALWKKIGWGLGRPRDPAPVV